jgi:hypothetical protein
MAREKTNSKGTFEFPCAYFNMISANFIIYDLSVDRVYGIETKCK